MENNFNNSNESIKNLENHNLEKEIDIIDGEGEVDVLKLEAEVKNLEEKNKIEIDQYNQIREDLGLDTINPDNQEVVEKVLPSSKSRFAKITEIGKNLMKAAAVAGVMFGATDSFAGSVNNPENNNKDKKETKTEVGNFYFKLKEYKIIPESMTQEEFQEKAKDDNWLKEQARQYTEARGIKSIDDPNAKVIKEIKYGLDETKKIKRELTKEQRLKELEGIWKDVNKGKYKMGDTVILSDGSPYVIKKYVPGTLKNSNNNDLAESSTEFKFLDDYTKNN